jgi:hypothetical protein
MVLRIPPLDRAQPQQTDNKFLPATHDHRLRKWGWTRDPARERIKDAHAFARRTKSMAADRGGDTGPPR